MAAAAPLTLDTIQVYIMYKVFDYIGNGSYKRYVMQCKNQRQEWAEEIHQAIHTVAHHVKEIQNMVLELKEMHNPALFKVCQTVIETNTPPVDTHMTINTCCISNKSDTRCYCINNKNKGIENMYIQTRFVHFVQMLWIATKIEHIIKSVARIYVTEQTKTTSGSGAVSLKDLSENFDSNMEIRDQLGKVLLHAYEHVTSSLTLYIQEPFR